MAANGISTLPTKEERQRAKLELAQTKRQQAGQVGYRELNTYDMHLLPAVYSSNTVVPQYPNLELGRPWTAGTPTPFFAYILSEASDPITTEGGDPLILE